MSTGMSPVLFHEPIRDNRGMLREVVERIGQRLQVGGISARKASLLAGFGPDFIRDLQRAADGRDPRRASMRADHATQLARVLGCSVDWLMTGQGNPSGATDLVQDRVPLVSWVAAGMPAMATETLSDWPMVSVGDLPAGRWIALTVKGDSMDQVAPDGSIIVVDIADRQPVNRGLFLASIGGETTFKRFMAGPPAMLAPYSSNRDHMPLAWTPATRMIGRVRRVLHDY